MPFCREVQENYIREFHIFKTVNRLIYLGKIRDVMLKFDTKNVHKPIGLIAYKIKRRTEGNWKSICSHLLIVTSG